MPDTLKTVATMATPTFPNKKPKIKFTFPSLGKDIGGLSESLSDKTLRGRVLEGDADIDQKTISGVQRAEFLGPFTSGDVKYSGKKKELSITLEFEATDAQRTQLIDMQKSAVFLSIEGVQEKGNITPTPGQQDLQLDESDTKEPETEETGKMKTVSKEKKPRATKKKKTVKKATEDPGKTPSEFAKDVTHFSLQSIEAIGMPPARNRVFKDHLRISTVMELIDFMEGKGDHYSDDPTRTIYGHPGVTKGIVDQALEKLQEFVAANDGDPIEPKTT